MPSSFEDWGRDNQDQVKVPASGMCFIDIVQPLVGVVWEVQMVTGATVKYSQSSITLLKNGALPIGTYPMQYNNFTGNVYDAAATAVGPPYIYLQHGESLRVQLTGGKTGDLFTVWWLYRVGVPYALGNG